MLIYIMLAVMPPVLSIAFGNLSDKRDKKRYLLVCGLLLFLFVALRSYSVGSADTRNYMNGMLRAIKSDSWEKFYNPDGFEVGFQMYTFLLSRFLYNPQWIVVISSAIFTALTIWFIYRNSDDLSLSITLYITLGLLTFNMQGMRQTLAMSLCLVAYELAKKRKILFLFAK